jgi:GTP-binding protein HflX
MEIRHRIAEIEDKLQKISEESELKRKRRSDSGFLEIALAGYTNAGKSTLHRALTGSQVEVANGLFTTLTTKSSDLAMDSRQVVLTDSVGFISDLPKSLLRAFNTTLMEIADADVILLVVDGSNSVSEVRRKANVCLDTFNRIGINGIPIVTALNKIDLIDAAGIEERASALDGIGSQVVPVSAKDMVNLPSLIKVIESLLPILSVYSIDLPYGDSTMSLISWLHQVGGVRNQEFKEDRIEVEASLSPDVAQKLLKMLPPGAIQKLESKPDNAPQPH